jgi:hypothetical protein
MALYALWLVVQYRIPETLLSLGQMEGKKLEFATGHTWYLIFSFSLTLVIVILSFQFTDTALTDRVGGDIQMYLQSQKGNVDVTINGTRGNPTIQFDSSIGANPNILIELTSNDVEPVDMKYFTRSPVKMQEIILTKDLELDVCASILEPGNPVNPVFALYDGVYWIHDPKFVSNSFLINFPP